LVSDELWVAVEPLLPPEPPQPRGGRQRWNDRAVLGGIIYVLKSGIPWRMLPKDRGCGSGVTCWRRLRNWQRTGVWRGLHSVLLDGLWKAGQIDWSSASLDSASVPADSQEERREQRAVGASPMGRGADASLDFSVSRRLVVRYERTSTRLSCSWHAHSSASNVFRTGFETSCKYR
jgi:transposase